ncbi:UDP-N-acetylmuramate--L-alanine ligase [Blattabacterium cuenoti]|uniref:UDP-N-acetylmuramate--L-alanine ligase n=1 Tax=Blattabacterium cuenoti TaxID=1653831 RepID=UPI00293C092E|nr:UDP-N-acetylmuramate--L-alanine ligase [Blattabacterium cuenoti]
MLNNINFFYFLGIGGIGMSSLARYFHYMGKIVYGHDQNYTSLTNNLENEGIIINYDDNIKSIPFWVCSDKCMTIYTPAIPNNHKQWIFLKKNVKNIKKRSQVLSLITKNKTCIAIGGTHGKTTTCSFLTHILYSNGIKITSFLGGISKNYESNFISNGKDIFLVEADEFDRSFLHLSPNIACITSLDQDHVDIYPKKDILINAYINFSKRIKNPYKKIFLCKEDSFLYKKYFISKNVIYYSIIYKEDYYSDNIVIKDNKWYFDFHTPKEVWKSIVLPIPGYHNLKNITAALSIADYLNINKEKIKKYLYLFKGIERRYSIHYNNNGKIYIDDYAHHPTEINILIKTVKQCFPKKKILGIFQPHLFSRTKFFENSFAKSLENFDFLILLEIYPSREDNKKLEYNINSNILLNKINLNLDNKIVSTLDKVMLTIKEKKFDFDIIMTIGAGNIENIINPIKKWLNKEYGHNN